MIKYESGKYVLYSKDGTKKLGSYPTYAGAIKREQQIEYFKNKGK